VLDGGCGVRDVDEGGRRGVEIDGLRETKLHGALGCESSEVILDCVGIEVDDVDAQERWAGPGKVAEVDVACRIYPRIVGKGESKEVGHGSVCARHFEIRLELV
jgi:hypothetical protein